MCDYNKMSVMLIFCSCFYCTASNVSKESTMSFKRELGKLLNECRRITDDNMTSGED